MNDYQNDQDKWGMTPVQVLCRAWERVAAGTHPTARAAIGNESAQDCNAGSPITTASGMVTQVFDSAFLRGRRVLQGASRGGVHRLQLHQLLRRGAQQGW